MRASSVQMLTRTYCWQRRRYLLERTCLHLFAPLDSRLLLAASVKMKILFSFLKKNYLMRTFVFFTRGTGYGIRMHNLSTCVWESRMAQDKKKPKKTTTRNVLVLHNSLPNAVQAIKTALPFPCDKDGVCMRNRTHQSINWSCKFHPLWFSPPQPRQVIFPLDALPLGCPVVISILIFPCSCHKKVVLFPRRQEIIAIRAAIKGFRHIFYRSTDFELFSIAGTHVCFASTAFLPGIPSSR